MDARNNLKIIHTVDGAILQNRYGKAVIQSHDIGLISIPTGEIVMADPTLRFEIADFKRKAFQQKVSPGIYPVFAYSAHAGEDHTLAFAEIRFTDQPPSPSRQPRPYVTPSSPAAGAAAMLLMSQRRD